MSAAIIIILRQRKLADRFRDAGATTPAAARSLSELGLRPGLLFSGMVRRGVFVRTEQDRYWFDAAAYQRFAERQGRRMMVAAIVIIAIVTLAVAARALL